MFAIQVFFVFIFRIYENFTSTNCYSETPDTIPDGILKFRQYRAESANCDRVGAVILKTGVQRGGGGGGGGGGREGIFNLMG